MDKEHRRKLQTTKLIIAETVMLVTIVLTVVILTFVVMGYRFTDDGKIEQSGLVGVDSIPTGATVIIDGEALTSKTNTSKILPEGEHTVSVEKDGYTSWQKTVSIHSGFLTKLAYPRLYKTDRKTEIITALNTPDLFGVSPTRKTILTISGEKLLLINIEGAEPKTTELNLKKILNAPPETLKILAWNTSGDRLLLKNSDHFWVIDLERPDYSLDLTATFGLDFSDLSFENDNGDRLFALENGNLRTISLTTKQLSGILEKDVRSFQNFGSKAIFVTEKAEIKLYDNTNETTVLLAKSSAETARALVSEYLGRFTLAFLENTKLTTYRGDLPTEDVTEENAPYAKVGETTLNFAPETFETRALGQAILTAKDNNFTVFDLETYNFSSFTTENNLTFWPDEYTIGVISDGNLLLRDFDGQNLVNLGPAASSFPAVITKDNKYLYLVQKDDQGKLNLVRENIK